MYRRVATALLTAVCLALAGCAASDDGTEPAESSPAATSSVDAGLSAAEQVEACAAAITDGGDSSSPECADLSSDDYLDALQAANEAGGDALQDLLDEASESAQP